MQLPTDLQLAIEKFLAGSKPSQITRSFADLSGKYRAGALGQRCVQTSDDVVAYVATRMPSIYCVVRAICEEVSERLPQFRPRRLLDIGSGPGTALWAAQSVWGGLGSARMLDCNRVFRECGMSLSEYGTAPVFRQLAWETMDLEQPHRGFGDGCDLVTACYVLSELSDASRQRTVLAAWEAASGVLIVVEPGTPKGFETILAARAALIDQGAQILGPCAAGGACPMKGSAIRWCHFSERVERTSWQRRGKGATLAFEDEKYSYVVASRLPARQIAGRIVDVPRTSKFDISINICDSQNQIGSFRVSKRDRERFARFKRLKWGSYVPADQVK